MNLNLPILDRLVACKNLLIAGAGGGYDVFCGLPIYFELRARGQQVHLANLSFTDIATLHQGVRLSDTLVGVNREITLPHPVFPERHLVEWIYETRGEALTVWCFHKTGARQLIENYRILIDYLDIDGILLVDGGVDSLARGDEHELGTLIEDTFSLIAVGAQHHVLTRLLACVGFGAERDITYAHILENMAALAKADAFLGSCSLVKAMSAYQQYEAAVLYTQNHDYQDPSVINSSIISAVQGEFGNYHLTAKTHGSQLWISPLMPVYWFYDLMTVAMQNHLITDLALTETFWDGLRAVQAARRNRPVRRHGHIPLT